MKRYFEQRSGQHRLDTVEIGNGLRRGRARLVGRRKGLQPPEPRAAFDLSKGLVAGGLDPITPAAAGFDELLLQPRDIRRRNRAAYCPDQELDARQHRLVEMHREIDELAGKRLLKDRGETQPQ